MLFTLSSKIASAVCVAIAMSQIVLAMPAYDLETRAEVSGLEARTGSSNLEFIGYTGTDETQAAAYQQGQFIKTVSSGAGEVLGSGIYLTDTLSEAQSYAEQAATKNKNTAYVCKFYADKTHWRGSVNKVWFDAAVRSAATYDAEAKQLGVSPPYVRMGQLTMTANQLILTSGTTSGLQATCAPAATVTAEKKSCDYPSMAKKWNIKGSPPAPKKGTTCVVQ